MNRQKLARSEKALNIVTYIILTIVVIFCALPFILVVSGSFSDSALIMKDGYSILPRGFSLDGYRSIFLFPKQIASVWNQYLCYRSRHLHWINRYDALRLCVIQK